MLIDTHAHLDDKQFDQDRDEIISRAFRSGVEKIINIGAGIGSSKKSVEIAQKNKNVFAAVGCHPHYFMKHKKWDEEHKKKLKDLAREDKVTAIGEIGLDYFSHSGENITDTEKKFQKEGFIFQLNLARELKLPVIIHCRDAYWDAWEIAKEYSDLILVYHCYGGDMKYTEELLQHKNIHFSFTGNITYAKPGSEALEVIKKISLERIMIETDCPYLTPAPYRGKRNEPAYVKYVAEKIAEIKGISFNKVVKITSENAIDLFKI